MTELLIEFIVWCIAAVALVVFGVLIVLDDWAGIRAARGAPLPERPYLERLAHTKLRTGLTLLTVGELVFVIGVVSLLGSDRAYTRIAVTVALVVIVVLLAGQRGSEWWERLRFRRGLRGH